MSDYEEPWYAPIAEKLAWLGVWVICFPFFLVEAALKFKRSK